MKSCAVTVLPSENLSFGFRWNVHTVASALCVHDDAAAGTSLVGSKSSKSVKLLNSWWTTCTPSVS